jgi:uncharacterized protein YodC (DUF2158 family)
MSTEIPKAKFIVGDVVELRSGSNPMTIREVKVERDEISYLVEWVTGGKVNSHIFLEAQLEEQRANVSDI